jgi:hypothetical protein
MFIDKCHIFCIILHFFAQSIFNEFFISFSLILLLYLMKIKYFRCKRFMNNGLCFIYLISLFKECALSNFNRVFLSFTHQCYKLNLLMLRFIVEFFLSMPCLLQYYRSNFHQFVLVLTSLFLMIEILLIFSAASSKI